jgi:hypothetical protein
MKEDDESRLIKIFPNPTNGQFNMQINQLSNLQMNSVVIYNVLGEKVYSNTQLPQSTQLTINLSAQATGIYFLQLKTDEGVLSKKLVVVK